MRFVAGPPQDERAPSGGRRAAPWGLDAQHWFALKGWEPFPFQREVWAAMGGGKSGLLHATTGSGKTYAVWFGALARATKASGLQVLWITPMRALASDTTRALEITLTPALSRPREREPGLPLPLGEGWGEGFTVGQRTGDTPAAERAKQDKRFPNALVTTPESLSLMLTRENAREELAGVHTVIVDEWHELIGSKRGVQVQLALARLRQWNDKLVVWGLSATLGNLAEAMHTLAAHDQGVLVQGRIEKRLVIDTLLPHDPGRFSWGGHLGAQMQQPVVDEIEKSGTTLVFTNVRSQAEVWYQLLLEARPDWAGVVALHHGSLDKAVREWVELGLKQGTLKAVIATSSLDLGVDFLPVERVLQIGSAKGIARLLQRAGRSGHAPGRASRATLVPTHTLELVEAAAARRAALAGRVEHRNSPDKPLDVLVQHLVTVALGGGFAADAMYAEVKTVPAYVALTREEFDWALAFVVQGGASLGAYPEYHRVKLVDGLYRVPDHGIARRHRLQVGTIVSDATMQIQWVSGGNVGTIEESFIARLSPGDCFLFAGKVLELVRVKDLTAYVKRATKARGVVPRWSGSKLALSGELSDVLLELLHGAAQGDQDVTSEPEMLAAMPMLTTQARLSRLPTPGVMLVERWRSREGHHLYLYPFAGRNVHIGLAGLMAWRLARAQPNTFSLSVNEYGLELMSALPVEPRPLLDGSALSTENLLHDVLQSLNSRQLAQRRFREIARVAGLIFTGYPGAPKSLKQLQASSSLFYEVFRKYDAGNLLLSQAENEVLTQELELKRLAASLERMAAQRIEFVELKVPSPFSLPLMVERLREQLTTEKLKDRLERILKDAEKEADR